MGKGVDGLRQTGSMPRVWHGYLVYRDTKRKLHTLYEMGPSSFCGLSEGQGVSKMIIFNNQTREIVEDVLESRGEAPAATSWYKFDEERKIAFTFTHQNGWREYVVSDPYRKQCPKCHKKFLAHRITARYCSRKCQACEATRRLREKRHD